MRKTFAQRVNQINDREKLDSAQQAVDLALQSVRDLYTASDMILAEHAYDMITAIADINTKLLRLVGYMKESKS